MPGYDVPGARAGQFRSLAGYWYRCQVPIPSIWLWIPSHNVYRDLYHLYCDATYCACTVYCVPVLSLVSVQATDNAGYLVVII
jgi:hypothetical protein